MSSMQQFLDEHFSSIIENRANKEWTPSLHANAEIVKVYPKIAGLKVMEDKWAEPKTIELRAETGQLMSKYVGVRLV